jgi:Uma2 family endonuclease
MSASQLALTEPTEIPLPPTQDELPCDDGVPMETLRHKLQMDLLVDPLWTWLKDRDAFVGGNMFLYYSIAQVRDRDFKGPDVFAVLDVPRGERKSWVLWEEGKGPDVVIELLSTSTAKQDKTEKKQIYQNQMRVTEYFWYDPYNPEDWAGFVLTKGVYEPLGEDEQGRLLSQKLGLALVRWSGQYRDVETVWLRWATLDGELLPSKDELAETEHQRAETERQRAETERQRAETERQRAETERQRAERAEQRAQELAEQLRAIGIEPNP